MDNLESSKLKLLEQIQSERQRLSELIEKEDEELKFLSTIWESSELDPIRLVAQTDSTDMITAIVLADEYRKENMQYIQKLVSKNRALYEMADSRKIRSVLALFDDLKEHELYDCLKTNTAPSAKKISSSAGFIIGIKTYFKVIGVKNIDIYSFMQSLDTLPAYIDALLCINLAKDIFNEKRKLLEKIDREAKKTAKKLGIPHDDIKKKFDVSNAKKIIYNARSYYDRLKQNSNSTKRAYRRELVVYEALEENINKNLSNGEIKNIKDLLFRISNPDVKLELLKIIYLHNQQIYATLIEEYQRLSSDPSSRYQSLLDKYGISPENYQLSSLMTNSLDDLDNMLQELRKLDITDPSLIIKIIQSSNLATVKEISAYVSKRFITTDLIKNNINIFNQNSREYKNVAATLAFFSEEGINPHYLRSNQELFLVATERIKQNIKILKDYNLISFMKTGMDCRFLTNSKLENGIDTLLELGYESSLEEDLSLLSYQENFLRLRILKELNIPLTSVEELKEVLSTEKFLIPDDQISTYLYNAVLYQVPKMPQEQQTVVPSTILRPYLRTERTYEIDGIYISKNKVVRNLNNQDIPISMEKFIYGVVSGSILSDEE